MIKISIPILFVLLLLNISVSAQSEFRVDFDYAQFCVNDTVTEVEVYYSFFQPGMKLEEKEDKFWTKGQLVAQIFDRETNNQLVERKGGFNSEYNIAALNNEKNLTGLLKFQLLPGNYIFKLYGFDVIDEENADSTTFEIEITPMPVDRFCISDLQLASSINQYATDTTSLFYKNSLEVIPNPGLTYFPELPVVFFYYEYYNINKFGGDEKLEVEHIVFNSRDERKYSKKKMLTRKNATAIDLGAISVKKFPSGTYTLLVSAKDSINNITVFTSKKFYLYNPDVIDSVAIALADADYMQSEIYIMSLEELDNHFKTCDYLSTIGEKDEWSKLTTIEAKRKYLYDFWKKRDPISQTPVNELKEEYFKRVEYANENFSHIGQRYGWKTDMGRIYISYGSPTEVERHPNEFDKIPYEIWNYTNIEGGVQFIFADYTSYSDYQLIHSTKRGEISNPNWALEIQTM